MDLHEEIKKLREDFLKGSLSESEVEKNPFTQFEKWLSQSVEAKIPEVSAVNLSTVSTEGKPSSRIVYLREFENNRFWFYTNYQSKKGKEMEMNPHVCLNFFWPDLERQIRIEGTVAKSDKQYSDNYFNNRPRTSQIGAWSSEQSKVLESREELDEKVNAFTKKFDGINVPRPDFWGGWVITANYYEFWQGRKSRLHDRIAYEKENEIWKIKRLAP